MDILLENAKRFSHHPAISWDGRRLSWELLQGYVHSTSRRIKEFGIHKGSRVLIIAEPSVSYIIVLLSLCRCGAFVLPVNPRLPGALLQNTLSIFDPQLIISDNDDVSFGRRRSELSDLVILESVEQFFNLSTQERTNIDFKDVRIGILTGGSSGEFKIAVLSFDALLANAQGANERIPFFPGDAWLLSLPLYHVSGLGILFRALAAGGMIAISSDNSLATKILSSEITHVSLVPSQFLKLSAQPGILKRLSEMKAILIGGAPIPEAVRVLTLQEDLPVFVTYGLTEAGSQVATGRLVDGARILPGREVRIGPDGEIQIRGACLFEGYFSSTCITPMNDPQGWFSTGDIGSLNDGILQVRGRKDNMFITAGENIHPEMIEKALLQCSGIKAAIVIGVPDKFKGHVPAAFIQCDQGVRLAEINRQLKEHLAGFMIPDIFFQWPDFPAAGLKVFRAQFHQWHAQGHAMALVE